MQAPYWEVVREVHQRGALPRGEAELPQRGHEEVWAGGPHPPQEGQAVQLHQGVQARGPPGVRGRGEEEAKTCVRQDPEERVQLQAPGALQGGGEEVLLQDWEEGLGAGLRQGEEGDRRWYL